MALMQLMQTRNGLQQLLMPALRKGTIEMKKAIEQADLYSDATLTEVKENPVMNDMLLSNFEQQVQQGNYAIYEIALKQDRSFVEDPGFPLMFLRANQYHVQKAVSQMINFLYQKASIFGIEKVAQYITLNDLDPRDLKLMLFGMFHIQDGTDRNGRSILYRFSDGHASDVDSENAGNCDDSSSADAEDSSGTSALEESASDDQEEQDDGIVPPPYSVRDVLLGKGYIVQNHPGNVAFREFLREHQEEYDNSPRDRKRQVMRNLTQTLKANGIRFLQKTDGDVWVQTSTEDAEKKVGGQVFRSARKLMNADVMN